MFRFLLSAILAISACGKANDTLSVVSLPGFELSLPSGSIVHQGSSWLSDTYQITDLEHGRFTSVQWQAATEATTGAELQELYAVGGQAAGARVVLATPTAFTVAGHDGLQAELTSPAAGLVTTWFCPEHQRQLTITSVGPRAVADAIFASVRCHTSPPPSAERIEGTTFPRYDAPKGMELQVDNDPSMKTWSRGDTSLMAFVGSPLPELDEGAATIMLDRVFQEVDVPLERRTPLMREVDTSGIERFYERGLIGGDDGVEATFVVWRCLSGRAFVASHTAPKGQVTFAAARAELTRLRCP